MATKILFLFAFVVVYEVILCQFLSVLSEKIACASVSLVDCLIKVQKQLAIGTSETLALAKELKNKVVCSEKIARETKNNN
jgi:predicted nucleic acid-binding protein